MDHQYLSDKELLAEISGKGSYAFRILYDRYASAVYEALYRRLPSDDQVKDLMQEVFIALFHQRKELTEHPNLKAWLLACCRNLVLREIRDQALHMHHHEQIGRQSEGITQPLSSYDLKRMEASFHKALARLSASSRNIFLLSREHKLSYQAIADELGISVNTVEKHMKKALRVMREEFREYGN